MKKIIKRFYDFVFFFFFAFAYKLHCICNEKLCTQKNITYFIHRMALCKRGSIWCFKKMKQEGNSSKCETTRIPNRSSSLCTHTLGP